MPPPPAVSPQQENEAMSSAISQELQQQRELEQHQQQLEQQRLIEEQQLLQEQRELEQHQQQLEQQRLIQEQRELEQRQQQFVQQQRQDQQLIEEQELQREQQKKQQDDLSTQLPAPVIQKQVEDQRNVFPGPAPSNAVIQDAPLLEKTLVLQHAREVPNPPPTKPNTLVPYTKVSRPSIQNYPEETPSKRRLTIEDEAPETPQSPTSRARTELEEIERHIERLEKERIAKRKLIEDLEAQKRRRLDSGYDADVSASKPRLPNRPCPRRRSSGKRQDDIAAVPPPTTRRLTEEAPRNFRHENHFTRAINAACTPATRAMPPQLQSTTIIPSQTVTQSVPPRHNPGTFTTSRTASPHMNNSSLMMNGNSLFLDFVDPANFNSQTLRLPWEGSSF